jgi:N-carbamoyl-L-amino-acid hydrolase
MSAYILPRPAKVNGARLWQSLMDLAAIGSTAKGGVCRVALTALDGAGRDLFVAWARQAGCAIRIDRIGNIFARRPGRDAARPPVLTGSHLDTQPTGGKFDGAYGVLAGLEVIRTLNDLDLQTEAPIEVAVWTNEEGSRFVPVMMGSGVFVGAFDLQDVLAQVGRDGVTVDQALQAIEYAGEDKRDYPVQAYFEAHIEQGPVLESERKVIGVVTGAMGQRWYDIQVQGMEAHAGPTPMEIRRDALVVAAEVVAAVNRIGLEHSPDGRGTVGCLEVFPNSRNVIPGRVSLTVDFRNASEAGLVAMDAELRRVCASLVREGRISVEVKPVVGFEPQDFTHALVDSVRAAAKAHELSHYSLASGAAHDAVHLARVAPTAMIFVPCKGGISHNEIEHAEPAHLEAGANVLLSVMLQAAGAVER